MLDDVERRKEVFAWFGGAAYHAQCFEVELQSLLLLTHRLNNPDAPVSELDDVDLRLSRKNLGTLLRELGMQFQLHPEFDGLLSTYRDRRNYLMHRFFFENARKLLNTPGCEAMIDELRGLSQAFQEVDAIAQEMSKRLRALAGWSKGQFDALVQAALRRDAGLDV